MKVIRTDNYDDEGPRGTQLVMASEVGEEDGKRIVDRLNADPRRSDFDWYKLVPDDYELFVFKP